MSVYKLVRKFSTREVVPVEVQDVVDFIRELGIKDEIYFWDKPVNTEVARAAIIHWEYPMGERTIFAADIHTAEGLPPYLQRVAQVKELLHILDPEHHRVNTLEDVKALIEKIVLPPDLVDWENEGIHANSDRAAIAHALAVLFPWAARQLLIGPYKASKLSLEKIADSLALPPGFAAVVLSDIWPSLHDAMMGPQQVRLPDKVTLLKADKSTIEVHSVPLGDDPYTYARRFHEMHGKNKPIAAYHIERRNGEAKTLSIAEITSYTPPAA